MAETQHVQTLLALDVGFSNTGYTVWCKSAPVDAGLLTTAKSTKKSTRVADDYSDRASKLAADLRTLCQVRNVAGIIGELPSGGSRNARAAVQMGMANAVVSATAALIGLPVEWCTPTDVKKAMTGTRSASKNDIMQRAIDLYGGDCEVKRILTPKTQKGYQERVTYTFLGKDWPAGKFEHIADSIGAYRAMATSNLIRLFG